MKYYIGQWGKWWIRVPYFIYKFVTMRIMWFDIDMRR